MNTEHSLFENNYVLVISIFLGGFVIALGAVLEGENAHFSCPTSVNTH